MSEIRQKKYNINKQYRTMEINQFIEKFAEIFDDTNAATLSPETKFRELDEWSSLTALGVIALADEEFDVELSGSEMRKANTIKELFELIVAKAS